MKHQAAAPGCLLALPGPVALCRVEVVRRSGLGGSGEGRELPYVHPQHMEGMKLHPPGAEQSRGMEATGRFWQSAWFELRVGKVVCVSSGGKLRHGRVTCLWGVCSRVGEEKDLHSQSSCGMWGGLGRQGGRVRLGFSSQPSRLCHLEWNVVGFSGRDKVGWKTVKARVDKGFTSHSLRCLSPLCCHTSVLRAA